MEHTATYSPEDNKLRLYPAYRLDTADYERMKAAGFKWAPKQELFVAPMWTPGREDVLLDLCGEIGDEDKSLVERAEERADRFGDYSDSRKGEAAAARKAVSSIADHIPLGQPILVGHHSERRARKDAERIENGMRRAVQLWDTAEYWKRRAAGAVAAAKYKERPDVRARRIKTIEADKRKQERTMAEAEKFLKAYTDPDAHGVKLRDGRELVPALLGTYEGGLSFEEQRQYERQELLFDEALTLATTRKQNIIAHASRWIAHYENRLAYERAMLEDVGGTVTDQIKPEKGGACRCWCSPHRGGWSYIQKVNKVSVTVLHTWGNGGKPHTVTVKFEDLSAMMTPAQVEEARQAGRVTDTEDGRGFYLADAPAPTEDATDATVPAANEKQEAGEPSPQGDLFAGPAAIAAEASTTNEAEAFDKLRDQLRQGVQVVSAPQLFPTPAALAARMVDLARLQVGMRVLEPSAGTGRLLAALPGVVPFGPRRQTALDVVAVEINHGLAQGLAESGLATTVIRSDFLDMVFVEPEARFDVVLMNPPFENATDIKHIKHAFNMLKPGGRLVGICANGPRQREALRPMAEACGGLWEALPPGTFQESGTGVNAALLVLNA
jgi:protein-L-isoaspartate O-methyltransferase